MPVQTDSDSGSSVRRGIQPQSADQFDDVVGYKCLDMLASWCGRSFVIALSPLYLV